MNSDNYRDQLISLLPPGKAISKQTTSGVGRMLHGFAVESERVDSRTKDLISESCVSTVDELLSEWETDFGLQPVGSVGDRKAALAAKVIEVGQQNPEYFTEIISKYGFSSTISQFTPAWCGATTVGCSCGDQDILFYWLVDVLDAGTTVDGMKAMMKEISRLKPGHTQVFFDYPDSEIAPDSITVSPDIVSGIINSEIIAVEAGEIVYRGTIYDGIYAYDVLTGGQGITGFAGNDTVTAILSEDVAANQLAGQYAWLIVPVLNLEITGNTAGVAGDVITITLTTPLLSDLTNVAALFSSVSGPLYFASKAGSNALSGRGPWAPKLTIQAAIDAAVAAGATYVQVLDSGVYEERLDLKGITVEAAAGQSPTITGYTTDTKIIYNVKCANAVTENQFAGMIFYGTSLDGDNLQLVVESNTAALADSYFNITFTTFIDSPVDNAKDMSVNTLIFRSNVNRGVPGEDEIQIFDFETGKEVDELAGYTFIQDVKAYVEAYPDPTAGGFGTVGMKLITGCPASRTIIKNEFAGMRISGVCGDGVTPFSYTIVSNTIDSGSVFSVTLLETITEQIEDHGFLIEELKTIGKTEYTITGNSFVPTGFFDFGFSSGFFRLGGYFNESFSNGFKKH